MNRGTVVGIMIHSIGMAEKFLQGFGLTAFEILSYAWRMPSGVRVPFSAGLR